MGAHGTGLFADDTACNVRDEFVDLLGAGSSATEATRALLHTWAAELQDVDDGPVFWLALAATQWNYGCLDDETKQRAIAVIDAGADLARWEGTARARRQSILRTLRKKLCSPQPAPRRPRLRKPVEVPAHRLFSPDGQAEASAFELAPAHSPHGPKMQVGVTMNSLGSRGGGGVFVACCGYDAVSLEWLGPECLQITYPASTTVTDQKPTCFYHGRTVQIVYRVSNA